MSEEMDVVLSEIDLSPQSEFDEDFIVAVPYLQHSDVSLEDVNVSIIAHNIPVVHYCYPLCLCSRKKNWTKRCPILRSLVFLHRSPELEI